jgi:light-regulated signal transduction histidine kinase (bacteriophytochrome)
VVSEPDLVVIQDSINAAAFLGLRGSSLLGRSLNDLDGDLVARLKACLEEPLDTLPIAVRCRVGSGGATYDGLIHRPPAGGLVIELERAGGDVDLTEVVARALGRILACYSLRALCDETAKIFREIAGYDRVMVYRFDDAGHGEVFSEQREAHLEGFLGNRYPASDIPQIARRLYIRNRVRVLVDVEYQPVGLDPRLSPVTGQDLDMSLSFLRSMSPIHIQYLKNMGVGATLVASLVVGGSLWGLVACHHYSPRALQFEIRSVCELLAEAVATRIAALESFQESQAELSVRRLEQRMIESISSEGDWRGALFDNSSSVLEPVGAGGAALIFEGQILTTGEVPGTLELREISRWLDQKTREPVFATISLGLDEPAFAAVTEVASGLIAAPISKSPGEYLMWFRPERIRTIVWGGDPFKPVVVGNDPMDLSPRRSFSQWHQLMEGNSEPWTAADLSAARLIGTTVADVVLQFRSVQMLIAQDQLDHVREQVQVSEQPLVIADANGRILVLNQAFRDLIPATWASMNWLHQLPTLFVERQEVKRRLDDLVAHWQTWRGEITLDETEAGGSRPLLVRADPVYATAHRVRGFVILFTDSSEQHEATIARERFQQGMIERHRLVASRIGGGGFVYHDLMSAVVENAQLAALEIADRADVERMPEMLESLRNSVTRTAEIVEHLIRHARPGASGEG